ncbi:MAG: toprim domain-containing protein [Aquificaceae bacterium]
MNLHELISDLRKASEGRAVLVEGKRDLKALKSLGVKNVYTIAGKRLTDLPDLLEDFKEVILLFDLDTHGERINTRVRNILSPQGYILIEEFRERLGYIGILFVEELYEKVRSSGYGSGPR